MKIQGKISGFIFKLALYLLVLQPLLASTAHASDMGELGALYVFYALMLVIFLIIVVTSVRLKIEQEQLLIGEGGDICLRVSLQGL